ncbi:hypothetical protein ACFWBX_06160 [Streptomyces sp. NPDC059991]|uniref:hypothetical protein n=1 Tax=Streptomyces sp. NPDC059991 TaxID=3347028 RepID=UPI0036810C50
MKYVKAAWDDEFQGFFTDATAYLAALPELEEALRPAPAPSPATAITTAGTRHGA